MSTLSEIINEHDGNAEGWEKAWKIKPQWDHKKCAPGLINLLNSKGTTLFSNIKYALVPGCGGGYDCFELASRFSNLKKIVGLDFSDTAFQVANDLLTSKYSHEKSRIEFLKADFFTFGLPHKFDLIYDYTFLCALNPKLRKDWAQQMANLLSSGGYLITLMFPLVPLEGGPPYSLSPEIYHELLDRYFECILMEDCDSFESRKGKEKIALWKRK